MRCFVTDSGYEHRGVAYRSLSEIARQGHWHPMSVPAFFGSRAPPLPQVALMAKEHVRCAIYTRKSSRKASSSPSILWTLNAKPAALHPKPKARRLDSTRHRYDDGGFSLAVRWSDPPAGASERHKKRARSIPSLSTRWTVSPGRSLTSPKSLKLRFSLGQLCLGDQHFNTTTFDGRGFTLMCCSPSPNSNVNTGERIRDRLQPRRKGHVDGRVVPWGTSAWIIA